MKTKILMVCLGNICRSPLAEAILKSKLDPNYFFVDSAGTGDWHVNHAPDPRSVAIAKKNGLDISGQRGRQFRASDFKDFDHIFVMDNSNLKEVLLLTENKEEREKVTLILNALFENENVDVPDPYYGSADGFDQVFKLLDEACTVISKKLSNQLFQ
ncbi:MAG: protein-tyrosine-phosphatase [Bacteroidetes bacterium HGW-Bacteroidetes-2]|jgi:protein-tyrosine phosphatase|nr:MAG: protein-tyrosine-phosphatase [Bacteroidetes bacterium HGW-Bacteroidetes-2]